MKLQPLASKTDDSSSAQNLEMQENLQKPNITPLRNEKMTVCTSLCVKKTIIYTGLIESMVLRFRKNHTRRMEDDICFVRFF